jgi:serine/threonine protein kinase
MDTTKCGGQDPLHDVQNASEESIVHEYNACDSQSVARRVARNLLIKTCLNEGEFQNQIHAWELLNGTPIGAGRTLRIPRPLRYFKHQNLGYFIMEYLDGITMEDGLCQDNVQDVANAIWQIHEVTSRSNRERPGPLDGSHAVGFPWGEWPCESEFTSIEDLQRCVDKRLRREATYKSKSFQGLPLCNRKLSFCHMDIVPRNILLMSNKDIAFLDWEHANYYPAEFDLASLWYWTTSCVESKKSLMEDLAKIVRDRSTHKPDFDKLLLVQAQSIQSCVSGVFLATTSKGASDFTLTRVVFLGASQARTSCLCLQIRFKGESLI